MDDFEVVEEFEEHHPGKQRQAVDIAVQPFVLAQDLACRADQGGQVVAGGQRGFCFFGCFVENIFSSQQFVK